MPIWDGSRDRTAEVVAGYPDVRLVRHPINRGYGAAIKTGFRHAQGDYLAFIDADGTYPPESLPDLCRAASEQKADLVIGSRMSGAHTQMPLTRRVGNLAYAALLSIIGNTAVRDTTSGMRLLRRSVLAHGEISAGGSQTIPDTAKGSQRLEADVESGENRERFPLRSGRGPDGRREDRTVADVAAKQPSDLQKQLLLPFGSRPSPVSASLCSPRSRPSTAQARRPSESWPAPSRCSRLP